MIVAPNSPEPASERERGAGSETATGERQCDAAERPCRAGPERARCGEQRRVDGLECGDRRAHVERSRDEGDREHDRDLGEADLEAERVQLVTQKPEPAERGQQADTRDGRRQHERQLDQREHERPCPEGARRDEVRRRCPEQDHHPDGDRGSS